MTTFSYNSDLTSGSLQTRECRILAGLLLKNPTKESWDAALYEENVLQKRTVSSVKRISQALRKRLSHLSPDFWKALRDGDDELATQVAFCAALAQNRLVVEFIEAVLKDAFLMQTEHIAAWQWHDFVEERSQRDPLLLKFSDQTREKMRHTAFRMLAEVGLVESTRTLAIVPIQARSELRILAEKHELERLVNCINIAKNN